MPKARGLHRAGAPDVAGIDPYSHESTAEAVARLTELVEAQARVIRDYEATEARSRETFERATAAARLGMWECDLTTETLQWSGGTYDMFGIERASPLVRKQTLPRYSVRSLEALEKIRSESLAQRKGFNLDADIVTARGIQRWIRITAVVDCAGNRPVRLFGMKQDITEEKARWDRLRYLAEVDELTGLTNRSLFQSKLAEMCETADPGGALLLIDLDGFKDVNDSLGHAAGDECLSEVARRLSRACPDGLTVARIGGDEFAVLLGPASDKPHVSAIAAHIVKTMSRPVTSRCQRFTIGASVGIAWIGGCAPGEIFQRADAALYAAKSAGKNAFRWFDSGHARAKATRAC
ncbi:MAG: diguanylate cyclase [Xanthobacteraceae bacterium]|uniref:diguanylate cyclase domain-containing protein n=1 Tax=Pseudolabrys sp. TaxID=1960880 RepID=UPI003D0BA5B7